MARMGLARREKEPRHTPRFSRTNRRDTMNDFLKGIGNAIGNVGRSVTNEVGRAVGERVQHHIDDINSVAKATEDHGILGGLGQTLAVLSPGNQVAHAVDSAFPGGMDPKLKDGIRAGVNIYFGNPVALKNLYDLATAPHQGGPAAPAQSAEPPAAALPKDPRAALDAAKASRAEVAARGQTGIVKEGRIPREIAVKLEGRLTGAREIKTEDLRIILDKLPYGGFGGIEVRNPNVRDAAKDKLKEMERELKFGSDELDKILNTPGLAFEDMIFMILQTMMRQGQDEVKELVRDARDGKANFEGERADLRQNLNAAEAEASRLEGQLAKKPDDENLRAQVTAAKQNVRTLSDDLTDKIGDFSDSRSEKLELIKNAMNKMNEMQQMLSNIMNSMHQTAMNTIGNIR
jgi:hypothetical protein